MQDEFRDMWKPVEQAPEEGSFVIVSLSDGKLRRAKYAIGQFRSAGDSERVYEDARLWIYNPQSYCSKAQNDLPLSVMFHLLLKDYKALKKQLDEETKAHQAQVAYLHERIQDLKKKEPMLKFQQSAANGAALLRSFKKRIENYEKGMGLTDEDFSYLLNNK